MITVIKPGRKPKFKKTIYKITCKACGCIFECEDSDLAIEKRIGGRREVNCPTCNCTIDITKLNKFNLEIREEESNE